jgi:hypothetical protein
MLSFCEASKHFVASWVTALLEQHALIRSDVWERLDLEKGVFG